MLPHLGYGKYLEHQLEAYFSGKETSYEVTYGQDDLVKSFKLIDFEQAFPKAKAQ